jgi:acetamidase/formamidase
MSFHNLAAGPDTVRYGMLDGSFPPILTIESGDTVKIQCVSGLPGLLPTDNPGMTIPSALQAIHDADLPRLGSHIVTGPVAVAGAQPGDMLEVRIDQVELAADWGYCHFRPLMGSLPDAFPYLDMTHIPIDRANRTCILPWGPNLKLSPFFGVMAVAPPVFWGRLSTREPRAFGGNMDNKELTSGSALFLPVLVSGANFSVGDGHGVQGDGEVCINALETSLNGTFTFFVHKQKEAGVPLLVRPRAETPTHFISMGFDSDLDVAFKVALQDMIELICSRTEFTPAEAYKSCSLSVDFHITQTVNGEKGVHGLLRKGVLF